MKAETKIMYQRLEALLHDFLLGSHLSFFLLGFNLNRKKINYTNKTVKAEKELEQFPQP